MFAWMNEFTKGKCKTVAIRMRELVLVMSALTVDIVEPSSLTSSLLMVKSPQGLSEVSFTLNLPNNCSSPSVSGQ